MIFLEPNNWLGNSIAYVTHSKFSHVGMVYNKDWIFEAHLGLNTRLNPLSEYENRRFRVLRPGLSKIEKHRAAEKMEEFNGTPYSIWDIATNFVFAWMKPVMRRKLVSKIGSKKMMICSELIGRILFLANSKKFKYFSDYGGLQPNDVFMLGSDGGMKEILDAVEVPPTTITVSPATAV